MANETNQTNSSHCHELFRQNYKFINFCKSSDKIECNDEAGENIRQFYQDLMLTNQHNELINEKQDSKANESEDIEIVEVDEKKIDPREFLKACQNDDHNTVTKYLSKRGDIFFKDSYNWNCIMITVVSFSNQTLSLILEFMENEDTLDHLLAEQDLSGSTAESLAQKVKNTKALELINKAREKIKTNNSNLEIIDLIEPEDQREFFCESCRKNFNLKDISHREHNTSIVHLINENGADLEKSKNILTNYHLRGNNKGYQLMIKSGWNERGLGSREQGRTMPVKTRQKLDRLGIGVDQNTKSYVRPVVNLRLKSSKSDSSMLQKIKSLKDTIEENKRTKIKERNLRRYFDL